MSCGPVVVVVVVVRIDLLLLCKVFVRFEVPISVSYNTGSSWTGAGLEQNMKISLIFMVVCYWWFQQNSALFFVSRFSMHGAFSWLLWLLSLSPDNIPARSLSQILKLYYQKGEVHLQGKHLNNSVHIRKKWRDFTSNQKLQSCLSLIFWDRERPPAGIW